MSQHTPPPMLASDEATEKELDMAREQGNILGKALDQESSPPILWDCAPFPWLPLLHARMF